MNDNDFIVKVVKKGKKFDEPIELETVEDIFNAVNKGNIKSFLKAFKYALNYAIELKEIEPNIKVKTFSFEDKK